MPMTYEEIYEEVSKLIRIMENTNYAQEDGTDLVFFSLTRNEIRVLLGALSYSLAVVEHNLIEQTEE